MPPAFSSCRKRIYSRRCRIQLLVTKHLEVSADADYAGHTEVEFETILSQAAYSSRQDAAYTAPCSRQ